MDVWFTVFAEFCDGLAHFPGLLDPEDEGIKVLQNVGNSDPVTVRHTSETGSICVTSSMCSTVSGRGQKL